MNQRLSYFLLFLVVIALGLLSRSNWIPELIYPYLGDALYAVMIFFLIASILPSQTSVYYFSLGLLICFSIEFSQLYQADWIQAVRRHKLGALILGSGFLWTDLLAYFGGASIAFFVDRYLLVRHNIK